MTSKNGTRFFIGIDLNLSIAKKDKHLAFQPDARLNLNSEVAAGVSPPGKNIGKIVRFEIFQRKSSPCDDSAGRDATALRQARRRRYGVRV